MTAARERVRIAFHADLQDLEKGIAPAAGDFAAEDARLNQLYRTIHATVADPKEPQRIGWGTVEKSGVRTAQRAWLRYRDAWVAFAARKYPGVPADAIKAQQTRRRNAELAELAGESR